LLDIGTGIFDSPTAIILQTENVGWSLMLWVVGFITTMAGTLMYIEYGLTIPRRHSHAAPRRYAFSENVFLTPKLIL